MQVMFVPRSFTKDGFEMHWGTNHVGCELTMHCTLALLASNCWGRGHLPGQRRVNGAWKSGIELCCLRHADALLGYNALPLQYAPLLRVGGGEPERIWWALQALRIDNSTAAEAAVAEHAITGNRAVVCGAQMAEEGPRLW